MSNEEKEVFGGEKKLPVFEAEYQIINGKKIPVIKAKSKVIVNEDGTRSVVIQAPSLNLINKYR